MVFGGKTLFQDPDFKADYSSILQIDIQNAVYNDKEISRVVDWKRLRELKAFLAATGKSNVLLFEDGVRASDIKQGALGDCWLLSSLACLATRAGAVEKLFLTPELNDEGRYQVRLWDKQNKQYKEVTIDDQLPVYKSTGETCFARPSGNEAWVLLLEKAMAKFVGNYHFLKGGAASWALETLTGHYTCIFLLDVKYGPNKGKRKPEEWKWLRAELAHKPADRVFAFGAGPSPVNRASMYVVNDRDDSKFYEHEEVFHAMVYHLAIGNLVAASTEGDDDGSNVQGVVKNHAYSVVGAKEVDSRTGLLRMVQVRNPHGAGGLEWSGDWSDKSTLWAKYPEVAKALGYEASSSEDGVFWMEWGAFVNHFKEVTFCCSRGFDYVEDSSVGWVEVFNDTGFPHDSSSLGDYKFIYGGNPMVGKQLDDIIKWLRLKEIAAPEQFRKGTSGLTLFSGGIHPDDIDGSSSGLMAAVACMANYPGLIEELFLTKEYRPDGCYQVRLYEPKTGIADITPFDDSIPCFSGNPITKTRILGSEVWVLLLEKAVARLVESYSKVAMWGVQVCWAFACLTGQYTCLLTWVPEKQKWRRMELRYQDKDPGKYRAEFLSDDKSLCDSEQVFQTLCKQLPLGTLAAAEADKAGDQGATTGLAPGRNYSILDVRAITLKTEIGPSKASGQASAPATPPPPPRGGGLFGNTTPRTSQSGAVMVVSPRKSSADAIGSSQRDIKLIKLRDPARTNEWKGDWCDDSQLWADHPDAAEALDHAPAGSGRPGSERPDGSFWMPYEDFLRHFKSITLCGNDVRGTNTPWVVETALLEKGARRVQEARLQRKLAMEQEVLEEALHADLRKRAEHRRTGSVAATASSTFTAAARHAVQNAPRRDIALPRPAPAPTVAAAGDGAAAPAPAARPAPGGSSAATAGAGAGAGAGAATTAWGGPGDEAAQAKKPLVVAVDYKGCRACTIM